MSNRPGGDPGSWGHLFLPTEPFRAGPGDLISVEAGPQILKDGAPGWLKWVVKHGATVVHSGHEFNASPAQLPDFTDITHETVPKLPDAKRLTLDVMTLMDGHRTVSEILLLLEEKWPDLARCRIEDEIRDVISA